VTATAATTLRYEGPRIEAALAATRSLGLGLSPLGPTTVTGARAAFTVSVPATLSWVQVLSLAEVLGYTRSPFEFVDSPSERPSDAETCRQEVDQRQQLAG
jgi:hypothetical protein